MALSFDAHRLNDIERFCDQLVSDKQFAGIAWRIDCQNQTSGTRVHGLCDHDLKRPLQPDSIYRLYSMTKPVISVLCLMLVEKGLLRLGDSVSHWVPAFASQKVLGADGSLAAVQRDVTIEDLLTHRSGLSYDFLPGCAVAEEYRHCNLADDGGRSLAELVNILANLPLAHQPGHCWYYSYATDVLAHVLECVANKPLRTLLQESLLLPLAMEETDFQVNMNQKQRLADMFGQRSLSQLPDETLRSNTLTAMSVEKSYPSNNGDSFARGGIGLFSTIDDYLKFVQVMNTGAACSGEPLLSRTMFEFMWLNRLNVEQMPIRIGPSAYPGYGWGLAGRVMCHAEQSMHLTSTGEGGWAGAASTYFWVDRHRNFSGLVMAQYLGSAISLGTDIQSLSYSAIV